MLNFMERLKPEAYALLRIVTGFMFALHGAQKILGFYPEGMPPGMVIPLFSQAGIGGIIELLGGLLVLVGWQTRLAAFICSGTMAVAYTQFHWKLQTDMNFFPLVNKGETAVLYCFVFFYIAAHGAGTWSLDKKG